MKVGEKEIEFKTAYTRAIDKEFNRILFNGSKSSLLNGEQALDINPMNFQDANDYLVKAMTNLTESEIQDLPVNTYQEILDKVNEIKNGEKSKGKN